MGFWGKEGREIDDFCHIYQFFGGVLPSDARKGATVEDAR
jgi:hypothetical protein